MSKKSSKVSLKPVLAGLSVAAVATSFSLTVFAADNPFEAVELESGYQLAGDHSSKEKGGEGKCGEGKCGEGKCGGGDKDAEGKCGEGKCGEGKCGG